MPDSLTEQYLNAVFNKELSLFEIIPGNNVLINVNPPEFTVLAVTESYLLETGKKREELIGRSMFEVFPSNPNDPADTGEIDLRFSFDHVIQFKKIHALPTQRYDVSKEDRSFEERYWDASNTPWIDGDGNVVCIIHSAVEITDRIKSQRREKRIKAIEKEHSLFMQAPIAIHILKGPELIIEMANEPTLAMWRKGKDVVGRSIKEVFPELISQGFVDLLNNVRETGEPYQGYEIPLLMEGEDREEIKYFNLIYQPYYEDDKINAAGVLVFANEVTDKIVAKNFIKAKEEENRKLAAMTSASHEFIGLAAPDTSILYANPAALKMLGWDTIEAKYILDCVYPDDKLIAQKLLPQLFDKGSFSHEIRFYNEKTGEPFWLVWNAFTIKHSATGAIEGLATVSPNITASKVVEQTLKESKERLGAAINAMEGVLWTNSAKGEMEGDQPGWAALTGQSYEEYKGYGWADAVHPDDAQHTIDKWNEAVREQKVFLFEHRIKVRAGEWRYFSVRAIPLLNTDGTIREWVGVHTDISEQKTAEEALRESEQRLRAVVESAPFPMGVYVGREMRIQLANQSILNVWGKGYDVIGKLFSEILPELDNQEIFNQLDKVYTTGIPFHAKNTRVDLFVNGKLQSYYFNYSFTPLFDAAGTVYGVMNSAADVTDLALAKQEVEKSGQNLRNIILQAPVAMCILEGPDHIVEIANDRMLEVMGTSAEAIMHQPVFDVLLDAKENLEPIMDAVYTTGERFAAIERPVDLPRKNGVETTFCNFVYEPLYETSGMISGVMAVVIDVTEQVLARRKIEEVVAQRTKQLAEANEALIRSNEELRKSNANLEEFAYAASHDLKEPIRKIHFFSDRLKLSLGDRLSEEEDRFFDRLQMSSKRMASLIDDLLSYSQVSLRPKALEEVDLSKLINLVLNDLDLEIDQKNARIITSDLPILRGHHRQLQQAFLNLIGNSLKYGKPGFTPEIKITSYYQAGKETGLSLSSEQSEKNFCVIEVADNGIGFDQRDADRIFSVFTRLHANLEYKGTGVGLSIVRKVIENHDGYVTAFSKPGEGALFKIYIPA